MGDERQARRQGGAVCVTRDKRGAREDPRETAVKTIHRRSR